MFYESQDIRIIAFATDDNIGFLAQKCGTWMEIMPWHHQLYMSSSLNLGHRGPLPQQNHLHPMLTLVKTEKELYTITKRERKEGLYAHVPKFKEDIKEI